MALAAMLLPTELLASDRLLFEMAGSTDWAIADFSIVAGGISETTRQTIYVTPETYTKISTLVASIGSSKAIANASGFAVTEFKGASPAATVLIPDEAVVEIMHTVILMFEKEHQAVPAIVPEIANSFAYGR
jgi:hypothetical protein